MIDPKQLRIGNYVKQGVVMSIKENTARIEYQLYGVDTRSFVDYCDIEPIPITEELLLKFGFESNPYQDRYEYNKWFFVECLKTRGKLELWFEFNNRNVELYYVHDLQNLYYSLTGEELQVSQNTKS